jgi:hypothetical protein
MRQLTSGGYHKNYYMPLRCLLTSGEFNGRNKATAEPCSRAVAQEIIARYILPLPPKGDDEVSWTERLLKLLSPLDDKATDILFNLMGLKAQCVHFVQPLWASSNQKPGGRPFMLTLLMVVSRIM